MHGGIVPTLVILTLGAACCVWLMGRLGLSPVIGYLLFGVAMGPFGRGLLPEAGNVRDLSDIGIILLMFFIGLEFRLSEMRAMLKACIVGGGIQIAATATPVGALAWYLGLPPAGAAVVGLMVACSSTAIAMKAYSDRGEVDSQQGRLALAVQLTQDIVAIAAVALLPFFVPAAGARTEGAESSSIAINGSVWWRVLLPFAALPVLFLGSRRLLPVLFRAAARARAPEAFSLLALGACLSVAMLAGAAGASPALGAFLGGLVLCQTPFASQILADLSTLRNLALGFFFVTVGMSVDLRFAADHVLWLIAALPCLALFKTLAAWVGLAAAGAPVSIAVPAALSLAQMSEFSFVLGGQAERLGLISGDQLRFLLMLGAVSMVIAPFLIEAGQPAGKRLADLWGGAGRAGTEPGGSMPAGSAPLAVPGGAGAIVVGYGPVGRTLTRILMDFGICPVIIELNPETVRKLRERNFRVVYGDAGRKDVLEAAGIRSAEYLLVTLPDLAARVAVVATAVRLNPAVKILSRARYLGERAMLEEAGASAVSYEEAEVAVAMAESLLQEIGAAKEDVERGKARIRSEIAVRTGFTMILPCRENGRPAKDPGA